MTTTFESVDFSKPFVEPRYADGHKWGPWVLDAPRLCLVLPRGVGRPNGEYEVDIEEIGTAFDLLDWVCQVSNKTWATPEIVGGLAMALNDLFLPQRRMRSDKHVPGKQRLADKIDTTVR